MKILAALKKIKHLDRKIEKTLLRIDRWSSYIIDNEEDPGAVYDEKDIFTMQQKIADWAAVKVRIRLALHLTNVRTKTMWEKKEYSIDELLLVQNVFMPAKMRALKTLNRKEKGYNAPKETRVVLQYDPKQRDMDIERIELQKEGLDELLDNLNIETEVIGLD
jgi:hypothetical protein